MNDIFELFTEIFTPEHAGLPEIQTIRRMVNIHNSLMVRADQKKRQVDAILAEEHAWVYPKGEDSTGPVEVPKTLVYAFMNEERQNAIAKWKMAYDAIVQMAQIASKFLEVYDAESQPINEN
jgi:hypothetical protein